MQAGDGAEVDHARAYLESDQVIGRRWSRYRVLPYLLATQLWRAAAVIVYSLAALTAGIAEAVPVSFEGSIDFTTATDCSPWCGSSEANANVIGVEGWLTNGQFQGGGAAATSAILGDGGGLGKTAAATASFEW